MTYSEKSKPPKMPEINISMPKINRRFWVVLFALAAGWFLISRSIKVVPAGRVGVVFSAFSGVKPEALQEGIHFITPLVDKISLYDGRLQEITLAHGESASNSTSNNDNYETVDGAAGKVSDDAIRARSKEGLDITADVTVQFRIDRAKAAILHKELGPNYAQTVIRPQIRSKVRDAIGQFSATDIISTQRQQVEAQITQVLQKVFEKNNLILESVLLRELRIPDSVAQAIEQKQTAEQQVAVEKNKLQQANISAQRAVVEAEGAAKASIAKARGEAEALSLRGKALRENPQLIQLTVAEKLSPTIQTVMLPSGGNFLLDLKSLQTAPAKTH